MSIRAVPEGTVVPIRNVLMTIENTDSKLFWLTNYLETLLVQTWYLSTVATISYEVKKTFKKHCKKCEKLVRPFSKTNLVCRDCKRKRNKE